MYQVHYMVPTASGSKREHSLDVQTGVEYVAVLNQCKKLGYTLLRHPMCDDCKRAGVDCGGEANWLKEDCVSMEVVA